MNGPSKAPTAPAAVASRTTSPCCCSPASPTTAASPSRPSPSRAARPDSSRCRGALSTSVRGAWRPDGKRIAVKAGTKPTRQGRHVSGGQRRRRHRVRLTHEADGRNHLPRDFSPNGRWLVFNNENRSTQSQGNLEIIDRRKGGAPQPLTTTDDVGVGAIRFAPDGSRILFADGLLSDRGALWTIRPDGTGGLTKVWDDEITVASHPAWSPDGKQFVFSVDPIADDFEHRPNALAVINADGSDYREVVRDDEFRRETTWLCRQRRGGQRARRELALPID